MINLLTITGAVVWIGILVVAVAWTAGIIDFDIEKEEDKADEAGK